MSTAIVPIEGKELEVKVSSVVEAAKAIQITGQGSYERAALFVKEHVNPVLKELDKTFDDLIDKTNKAHKEAVAQKKRHYDPMKEAKNIATQKCKVYEDEQARIQREKDRIAEEEARKLEEEERLNEAEAAQDAGAGAEEVDAILETPLPTAPAKAAPTFTRVKGLGPPRPYSAQVTHLGLLVMHIAGVKRLAHPELLNLLLPKVQALNAMARAQGSRMQIPGVKVGRF